MKKITRLNKNRLRNERIKSLKKAFSKSDSEVVIIAGQVKSHSIQSN